MKLLLERDGRSANLALFTKSKKFGALAVYVRSTFVSEVEICPQNLGPRVESLRRGCYSFGHENMLEKS